MVAGVVCLTLLVARSWRFAPFVVLARAGELATETAVKGLLARPRPTFHDPGAHAASSGFPSGSAAMYGALILLSLPRIPRWSRPYVLVAGAGAGLICAVAASRVLLGLHYLSDVAGALVLGVGWVAAAAFLLTTDRTGRPRREPGRA